MMLASVLSIAVSGVLLALLGLRDPKRLRNAGHGSSGSHVAAPLAPSLRRAFGWLSLAPGVVLAVLGQWWAFFIWLGVVTALGWAVARGLAES
jgi:hypothetical protein